MDVTPELVENIIAKHNHNTANLVMILQDIQDACGCLAPRAIELVSEKLELPESRVYAVATFYSSFSLEPRGKHKIEICEGTACHIRGAPLLMDHLSGKLGIKAGGTTADGEFTLESVHCVGACAMGPVAVIDGSYHGNMTAAKLSRELKKCSDGRDCECAPASAPETIAEACEAITGTIDSIEKFNRLRDRLQEQHPPDRPRILVCAGTGCLARGSLDVAGALLRELSGEGIDRPLNIGVKKVGCLGLCERGPLVALYPEKILYTGVRPSDAGPIIRESVINKKVIERLLHHEPGETAGKECYTEIPFYALQEKAVLRRVGLADPLDITDYIAHGGYTSLFRALDTMDPAAVIEEVERSGLRGRGGGGFSTGRKWRAAAASPSEPRYVICNGDEGDPGAFMDCSIMEGDPHSVIEGMAICAYAVGASQGYIYVRAEYPRALRHLQVAIDQARRAGFLGRNIGGKGFSFDIQISRGAGAFVCGESTALMHSLEGNVGEPRAKYIRSAERGLYGKPTVLNNVETFANVPLIIELGAGCFASSGTPGSKGTKIFSVVGKVKNTGLIEVPMGTTLRTIIYDICGGIRGDKRFKAVQTGGPSGGCLPAEKLDLPVDFDSLAREGSMMGSGGMIVMDEDTCMVDVARYFTAFLSRESCGKCAPCRLGLDVLSSILERVCRGEGELEDIQKIDKLLLVLENASLCGLGRSAPNPVRSTLTHFRSEYLAHIVDKKCPGGVCRSLISYEINELCAGCGLCAGACPRNAISTTGEESYIIDQSLCNRCGACMAACKHDAVEIKQ